jgi:TonB family protein
VLNKFSDTPVQVAGEYFIWSVPEKPVSVHLKLETIELLTSTAVAGLGTLPRRGLEVGGVLLGRIHNPNPDQYIVAVEKIEPLEIEHVRGPSYILSAGDREELFTCLRKHEKKSRKGISVVGFYRSHTRMGLYMDEYDYDLMRSFFAHPSSIALLMRPTVDGHSQAGFFIWEDGEIQRSRTYREFPLDVELLRARQETGRPDVSAPLDSPLPAADFPNGKPNIVPSALPAQQATLPQATVPQATMPQTGAPPPERALSSKNSSTGAAAAPVIVPASAPAIEPTPVPAPTPAVVAAIPPAPVPAEEIQPVVIPKTSPAARGKYSSRQLFLGWTAAAVLLIVGAALWQPSAASRPHNLLALNAEPTTSGLRLTWDRSNPLITNDVKGTLVITDGTEEKQVTLDAGQLKNGTLIYWPTSPDVNFRLQIGDFAESLRAIAPRFQPRPPGTESAVVQTPSQPQTPAQAQPQAPAVGDPATVQAATPGTSRNGVSRARSREVRPAVLPGEPARPAVRPQELPTPPPAEIASTPTKLDRPVVTERQIRPPSTFADIEPVRASGFKRAVSAIFRKGGDEEDFVPARVVRKVNPSLPGSLKLAEDTRVSVKVSLDETGRVQGTDLISRNVDARLANAAMDAAKRWRFEPARQQEKKVGSSVILHFRFNREEGG